MGTLGEMVSDMEKVRELVEKLNSQISNINCNYDRTENRLKDNRLMRFVQEMKLVNGDGENLASQPSLTGEENRSLAGD